jgi:hypothetical protein
MLLLISDDTVSGGQSNLNRSPCRLRSLAGQVPGPSRCWKCRTIDDLPEISGDLLGKWLYKVIERALGRTLILS